MASDTCSFETLQLQADKNRVDVLMLASVPTVWTLTSIPGSPGRPSFPAAPGIPAFPLGPYKDPTELSKLISQLH